MRTTVKIALVAIALAGTPLMTSRPAAAEVSISVNPGGIAFGYADGYWDRDHHWHAWRNKTDAQWYRDHYHDHYYAYRHDRDHGDGWRDERWWDHH
jgi:hypothetical protein